MKKHQILLLILVTVSRVFPQPTGPFQADSTTRALWHFEDTTGTIIHDWVGGHHGIAIGTSVVPGRFGYGRFFNGTSDYVNVPSDTAFDFGEYSFKIDVWFKTSVTQAVIIRRGLAPDPGFEISMHDGHIDGQIGNRGDSSWPDTLLTVTSDSTYNDNAWHLATLERDRSLGKLFLYIDGSLATQPINDPIIFPINSNRPLTIGRWEYYAYPYFFAGSIDEVRICCTRVLYRPAVSIDIQPRVLDFGTLATETSDTMFLTINNKGFSDSLRVSSIASSNVRFYCPPAVPPIPPHGSASLAVVYTPAIAGRDTGSVLIASNDSRFPLLSILVSGRAIAITDRPIIVEISRPYYSQARLIWFRSIVDASGSADPVTEYSIWRRISDPHLSNVNPTATQTRPPYLSLLEPLWEFVETVPAMRFERYSALVPLLFDTPYNVFVVAAQTSNREIFISDPDSIMLYPPLAINEPPGTESVPTEVSLAQNYPNPFNPSTTIRYGLPGKFHVSLSVYNALGELVARLNDGEQEPGYHVVRFDGSNLPSGVYFYRLRAGDMVFTKKFLLVK